MHNSNGESSYRHLARIQEQCNLINAVTETLRQSQQPEQEPADTLSRARPVTIQRYLDDLELCRRWKETRLSAEQFEARYGENVSKARSRVSTRNSEGWAEKRARARLSCQT